MTRGGIRTFQLVAVLFAMALVSREAGAAETSDKLEWKPEWATFRPVEYVLTGVAGVASLGVYFGMTAPDPPHWVGGILFDDAARDALRLRSPGARDAIRTASDATAVASVVLVVGVDSIIVPLARKSDFVALELTLMNAESYALSTLITSAMFKTIGRGRPSYEDCQRNPNFDPLCNSAPTASFPSGHANAASTAAGLSCAHHGHLSLYGSPFADAFACGTAVTLAAATATFRVMGDRHYASDVLVGSIIGFGIGFAGPTLLHYSVPGGSAASAAITPMGGTATVGFMVSGMF